MILLVAVGLACTRAGGDARCYTVCERANACTITERPLEVECSEFCPDVPDMLGRMEGKGFASCQAEYDQHLECWMSNLGQICTGVDLCAESGAAWTTCMTPYCEANAADVEAAAEARVKGVFADPNCSGDTPGLAPF
jgi:hypothetical protein